MADTGDFDENFDNSLDEEDYTGTEGTGTEGEYTEGTEGTEGDEYEDDPNVLQEYISPDYEPTEDELREYANFLGMDFDNDKDLMWIAREGLKAPLPKDWKACKTDEGQVYYFNFASGESLWQHPCDLKYKEIYKTEKAKKDAGEGDGEAKIGDENEAFPGGEEEEEEEEEEALCDKAEEKEEEEEEEIEQQEDTKEKNSISAEEVNRLLALVPPELADTFESEEFEEYTAERFAEADVDSNGYLDRSEMHSVLNAISEAKGLGEVPKGSFDNFMTVYDANESGTITQDEFNTFAKVLLITSWAENRDNKSNQNNKSEDIDNSAGSVSTANDLPELQLQHEEERRAWNSEKAELLAQLEQARAQKHNDSSELQLQHEEERRAWNSEKAELLTQLEQARAQGQAQTARSAVPKQEVTLNAMPDPQWTEKIGAVRDILQQVRSYLNNQQAKV